MLAPVGRLGDVRYGLGAFLIKYHFNEWGRFQPFAGAGLVYFKVLRTSGVGATNPNVDDGHGPALQSRADFTINLQIGLFASVSHAFLYTHGTGTCMGLPAAADIKLDPTVFQSGLVTRF